MGRDKSVALYFRTDSQSANRLEVDRAMKGYETLSEQFEKIIWFYLSMESASDIECKLYREKLLALKINLLNTAMREDSLQGITENITEIMVRLFLYKRLNLNKSSIELYELEFFKILNEIQSTDKNLFEEIVAIYKAFGIKSNKYRSLCAKSGKVEKGGLLINTIVNNTIDSNNKETLSEKDIKYFEELSKIRNGK